MKYISYFLFSILLISCGKSSDVDPDVDPDNENKIDENSTFFERFDGSGFEKQEGNQKRDQIFYFNEDVPTIINVDFNTGLEEICQKCITWIEGDNIYSCENNRRYLEISFSLTITENTYDRLVFDLKDYSSFSGPTDPDLDGVAVVNIPEGIRLIYEAIDDDNILSKLTPYSEKWNGSLDTVETNYSRVDIEFSSINCDDIEDVG